MRTSKSQKGQCHPGELHPTALRCCPVPPLLALLLLTLKEAGSLQGHGALPRAAAPALPRALPGHMKDIIPVPQGWVTLQ